MSLSFFSYKRFTDFPSSRINSNAVTLSCIANTSPLPLAIYANQYLFQFLCGCSISQTSSRIVSIVRLYHTSLGLVYPLNSTFAYFTATYLYIFYQEFYSQLLGKFQMHFSPGRQINYLKQLILDLHNVLKLKVFILSEDQTH